MLLFARRKIVTIAGFNVEHMGGYDARNGRKHGCPSTVCLHACLSL